MNPIRNEFLAIDIDLRVVISLSVPLINGETKSTLRKIEDFNERGSN
jgi:hypothetical protein